MLRIMLKSMDMSNKKIITLPCFIVSIFGIILKLKENRSGRESGLDFKHIFKDIMCKDFYFDPSDSAKELGYGRGDIKKSIEETVLACIK